MKINSTTFCCDGFCCHVQPERGVASISFPTFEIISFVIAVAAIIYWILLSFVIRKEEKDSDFLKRKLRYIGPDNI